MFIGRGVDVVRVDEIRPKLDLLHPEGIEDMSQKERRSRAPGT